MNRRTLSVLILSVLAAAASVGAFATGVAGAAPAGPSSAGDAPAHGAPTQGPASHLGSPGPAGRTATPAAGVPRPSPRTIVPGTWSLDTSPNPATDENAELQGTSCVTATFCVAVGDSDTGTADVTLVEQWNGTTWAIVPSPNVPSAEDSYLEGVSCPTTTFCVAAGSTYNGSEDQTLIEQWNGTSWSIVPSPDRTTTTDNGFDGVSCLSSTSCVAVGYWYNAGDDEQALVEQWNGAAWSLATAADTADNDELDGVSCALPTFCVATGYTYVSGSEVPESTLVEEWNGTTWTIVTSPNPVAGGDNVLNSVSCASATFCVAAGYGGESGAYTPARENSYRTLVEQWNGTAWSIVASPSTSTGYGNFLYGVSCVGPTSCTAAGGVYTDASAETYVTLVLAWDGTSWTLQSSPNPTATANFAYLEAVNCIGGQYCVAVGGYEPLGDNDQTLIESAAITRPGYRFVASDGGVFNYGGASFNGSAGSLTLNKPVVGMAATPDGGGYWLVASDGGIFSYGDAVFYGSTGSLTLNKPIVGMASTPDGGGYWLVASDGGIFAYGDASFYGSTGSLTLNKPIVGMAATPSGHGYWLVASDGGIFAYGDALFYGSTGGLPLNKPIVGMASTPSGNGYWLVASDGGIFSYGDALFHGSAGSLKLNKPVVGMAATPSGLGYWLVASDGGVFSYGDAVFHGSTGSIVLNKPIVGMSA